MSTFNYFSGLFGNNTTNSVTDIWNIYSNLGDYNTIKSGSYRKLLNAYYKKEDEDRTESFSNPANLNTADKKEFTEVKKTTDDLQMSAKTLLKKGESSVYNQEDRTALVSAVKNFISDYNRVIDKAGDSSDERVLSKTLSMVNNTKAYASSLEQIGIGEIRSFKYGNSKEYITEFVFLYWTDYAKVSTDWSSGTKCQCRYKYVWKYRFLYIPEF